MHSTVRIAYWTARRGTEAGEQRSLQSVFGKLCWLLCWCVFVSLCAAIDVIILRRHEGWWLDKPFPWRSIAGQAGRVITDMLGFIISAERRDGGSGTGPDHGSTSGHLEFV